MSADTEPTTGTPVTIELEPENLFQILEASFFAKGTKGNWGLPLLVEDQPGTTKTSLFGVLARKYGVPFLALSPGLHGEGVFGTVPAVDPTDSRWITFPAPKFGKMFLGPDEKTPIDGLVLIDEVKTTGSQLQPVLLGAIDERKIGFHYFGGVVRFFGATNEASDSPNGSDLAPSVANRFGWLKWKAPTEDEWCRWMLSGAKHWDQEPTKEHAAVVNARIDAVWDRYFSEVAAVITSFISRTKGQNKLHSRTREQVGTPADSGPWGSRRTWEMATRALTSARIWNLSDTDTRLFVGAFIGPGLTQELFQFMAQDDIPSAEDLLTGVRAWDQNRMDLTMICSRSMAMHLVSVKNQVDREDKIKKFWSLLEGPAATDPDTILEAVDLACTSQLMRSPHSAKVLAYLAPMMSSLGHQVAPPTMAGAQAA